MSLILTNRQAEELHKSVIAYLSANNLETSVSTLREELDLGGDAFDEETARKYESLLEKKWTSIVRLQKKVMDLEARNATLQTEIENAVPNALAKRNQDPASWLPKLPPRHTLESHREAINCTAFHPVFSSIASGSDDYTIKIWDWEFGTLETTIKGHTRAVLDLDYGGPRNALLLASCSSDLTIKLWNPADGYKNIRTLQGHEHSISSVRFMRPGISSTLTGNLLVSASGDQTVKIWDAATGFCVKTLQGHTGWVRDVCPSIDGRFILSTGNDRTIRLWDTSSPDPENKLTMIGHENVVKCCAFAPPASYRYLSPLAGQKKIPAANSTAEFMASGSRDKSIKLWDAKGTCFLTLTGHDNWISALVFHPGGKFILSVADDKTMRCWDLSQGGKCVKVLGEAHEQFITCIRWSAGINKDAPATGDVAGGPNGENNGTPSKNSGKEAAPEPQIRCVIATGSMDTTLKIYAN